MRSSPDPARRPRAAAGLATLLLLLPLPAWAGDEPRFELALEGVSRYVFGGLTFSDRPVFHPSLAAAAGGFRLTGFATWYSEDEQLLEADVFLEYGARTGRLDLFAAAGRYHFKLQDGWRSSFELYAGAAWDGPLQPSIAVTEDFDVGDGGLVEAAVARAIPLGPTRTLTASVSLTHNRHYYSARSGFSHVELALALELPLGARLLLRPRIAALASLRDDVDAAVYGGLRVGFGF